MRTISSVPSGFQCTDSDDIGKSIFFFILWSYYVIYMALSWFT